MKGEDSLLKPLNLHSNVTVSIFGYDCAGRPQHNVVGYFSPEDVHFQQRVILKYLNKIILFSEYPYGAILRRTALRSLIFAGKANLPERANEQVERGWVLEVDISIDWVCNRSSTKLMAISKNLRISCQHHSQFKGI